MKSKFKSKSQSQSKFEENLATNSVSFISFTSLVVGVLFVRNETENLSRDLRHKKRERVRESVRKVGDLEREKLQIKYQN